jgi:hypothetical protein
VTLEATLRIKTFLVLQLWTEEYQSVAVLGLCGASIECNVVDVGMLIVCYRKMNTVREEEIIGQEIAAHADSGTTETDAWGFSPKSR